MRDLPKRYDCDCRCHKSKVVMHDKMCCDPIVPIRCPICGYLMKGKSTNTYYQWGICMNCTIEFVEQREQRWIDGWRPSPQEISNYIKKIYPD